MSFGSALAWQYALFINRTGNVVTLADATTVKAEKIDEDKRVSRFFKTDGLEPGEKLPLLFRFAGVVWTAGKVRHGAQITCEGQAYQVQSEHPQHKNDVCVEYFVVAYRV